MSIFSKIKSVLHESLYRKEMLVTSGFPIVSFSFDDIPVSAITNGARILENAGAVGTFYISTGMSTPIDKRIMRSKGLEPGKINFANMEEVADLKQRGHNIGCHTKRHLKANFFSGANRIIEDSLENASALYDVIGCPIEHFSYPFGKVNLKAKKVLQQKYSTMRSTAGGINIGKADLSYLRANSIYSSDFDKERLKKLIYYNNSRNGWLIFYTHEVCDNPNCWGTTVEHFSWLVNEVYYSGAQIMSIEQAYAALTNKNEDGLGDI